MKLTFCVRVMTVSGALGEPVRLGLSSSTCKLDDCSDLTSLIPTFAAAALFGLS